MITEVLSRSPDTMVESTQEPSADPPRMFPQLNDPPPIYFNQEPRFYAAEIGHQYQMSRFARCAQGDHDVTMKYGVIGIIFAVILFPLGLIVLCIDSEKRCARCRERLGGGCCGDPSK